MKLRRLSLALLGALFATSAVTAADAVGAKTYAVIVGAGEFKDEQIKPRPASVADAQAVYDLLTNKDYLGLDAANITLLLTGKDDKRPAKEATKANIIAALADVAKKATKDDSVIILLAGQGASAGEKTAFFAADTVFKERAKTAVLSNAIADAFKDAKTEHLIALLDINFKSFEAGKDPVVEPKVGDMMLAFFGIEKEDDQNLPNGRAVIFATAGPSSLDVDGHSIFTTTMLDALKGAADVEGGGPDGFVTVDELSTYLDKNEVNLAREHGKTTEQKEQIPFALLRSTHFALTRNPKVYPLVKERLDKLAKTGLPEEALVQGMSLLSRMPKLKALRELRGEFEKFVDGKLDEKAFLAARDKILAGLKLNEGDAQSFATRVLVGVDTLAGSYIKELDRGDLVAKAIDGMYKRSDVKMSPELAEKVAKAKGLGRSDLRALLTEARLALGKREDLESNKDADAALTGMLLKIDPYTNYTDAETKQRLASGLKGYFTGIGVQIRRDLVRDGLLVVTPIKGSPAYRAGLQAGDLITKIIRPVDNDGTPLNPPEELSTKGMKVDEAVKKILGKPDTKITVVVERDGKEIEPIDLYRKRIDVESVLGYKRNKDDSWDFYIDPVSKIGYIHLTQFVRNSYPEMLRAVEDLERKGMKGLILDLRFNPGGYLDSAVNICDLFIDDGLIVTIRPRVGGEATYTGKIEPSKTDFPMVVLVNGFSASGSEIVGGCLQDHQRAVIMGERSYGKGSVQNIATPFGQEEGEIKMTTATFWRPISDPLTMKGNLNKASHDVAKLKAEDLEKLDWGVKPAKEFLLELTPQERGELEAAFRDRELIPRKDGKPTTPAKEDKKDFKDRQLEMALKYLQSQIKGTARNGTDKGGS